MGRRTGIAFETVPPPLPDTLPRMDIAAFVGFAQSGPVDLPVAVEDVSRFRDVFGDDPVLAFDAERSTVQRAYLGSAVEAFFAGGGQRCWVIRVAEQPQTLEFELPGLTAALPSPRHARVRARAPGSWALAFEVGTMLTPTRLVALASRGADGVAGPHLSAVTDGRASVQLDVTAAPRSVTEGDLLMLRFPPTDLLLFVVAGKIQLIDRGLRVHARSWHWLEPAIDSPDSSQPDVSERIAPLPEVSALNAFAAWEALAPGERGLEIQHLTFEISVWRDGRLHQKISKLAFSPIHPRFWGNLPSDDDLFGEPFSPRPDGRDVELLALRGEASGEQAASAADTNRRFPFASCEASEPAPLYLPDGMALGRSPALARGPVIDIEASLPERDGLAAFGLTPFFDARLQNYSGESLLRSAEQVHNAARERAFRGQRANGSRLRGLHALLAVEEATMAAVPDVVHRAWSTAARPVETLLRAPFLEVPRGPDEAGRVELIWSSVADATDYELQHDQSPDLSTPQPAYQGDAIRARVSLPPSCAPQRFFRVRALRHGEPSPWSNTRILRARPGEFLACAAQLAELQLQATELTPGHRVRLSWSASSASSRYRVETAGDALFESVRGTLDVTETETTLPAVHDHVLYCRVRAEGNGNVGPWSNTAVLLPRELSRPTLAPLLGGAGYDDAVLLSVHRALVRFCHARGDLLALLSLPRHYKSPDLHGYLAALSPDETDEVGRSSAASRPLTLGEAPALSFAALYHPWFARRIDRGGVLESEFMPPEGAAAGLLARIARERGAWISTANRPMPGVLALDPDMTDAHVAALVDLQVNVGARDPRGFALLDDQTLSRDSETRLTPVRRLLILLKRLALREGTTYVFEPYESDFPNRVRHRFQVLLSTLHRRGAFSGTVADEAFRVVVDESVNPPQSVDVGRFVVELRVAPARPLSFLRVRLVQTGPEELLVGEA